MKNRWKGANAEGAPTTGERVNHLAFRQLSIKQIAAHEGCDPEVISSQFGEHYRAGRLRAAAQAKQALMVKAIQGNDVRAQITLAKRYLGLSDKAPPPPPPPPTYHVTFEESKSWLEELVNKYPHLLDPRK